MRPGDALGWPDPERYLTCWPRIADEFGERAFDHGTAHGLEDCVAIALWLPPGVQPDAEIVMRLMRESTNDKTFEEIIGVFEQMDALHPTVDHWYLPLTGVDPVAQRCGLGSSLLRHALKTCDSDGLPGLPRSDQPTQPQPLRAPWLRQCRDDPGGNVTSALAMLREPAP